MAGDWLKFEKSTSDKPEVWAMADALSIDPDAVVGKLLRVWSWFDEQSEEGNAPSVSKSLLDRRVGVTGFCDSMVSCGWMQEEGGEVVLPNFDRHNGQTAKNRALTAKRVAKHKGKSNEKGNGPVTMGALPREEKRREEVKPPIVPQGDAPPFDEIVNLYHQILPELPRTLNLTDVRKRQIAARWKETFNIPNGKEVVRMKANSLDFWERYFRRVANQPLLMGEKSDWTANLEWLTKPKNMVKALENTYLDKDSR